MEVARPRSQKPWAVEAVGTGEDKSMRTVLITGSSRGLGLELVKQHMGLGDHVYATYRSLSRELEDLAKQFSDAHLVKMDVSDGPSVREAAEAVAKTVVRFDIVYSNAGVYRFEDEVPFSETDFDRALHIYNTNALGFMRVVQAFLPMIGENTMVCGISSDCASIQSAAAVDFTKAPRYANYPYYMSKAATNMAGCLVDGEIRLKKADLILIHPGWMKTDMGGPNATVPVQESAAGIIAIATRAKPVSSRFVDYTGKPMAW